MYFRCKTSAGRAYLQIVESRREGDQVRQQVIATLGRFEDLQASGQLERLVRSGARFAAKAMIANGGVAPIHFLREVLARVGVLTKFAQEVRRVHQDAATAAGGVVYGVAGAGLQATVLIAVVSVSPRLVYAASTSPQRLPSGSPSLARCSGTLKPRRRIAMPI
jgi:hypothetical protein